MLFRSIPSLIVAVAVACIASGVHGTADKVTDELRQKLSKDTTGHEDILVYFPTLSGAELTSAVTSRLSDDEGGVATFRRGLRRSSTMHVLREYREIVQEDVLTVLTALDIEHTSFWINNAIFVRGASQELVSILADMETVQSIDINRIVATIDAPVQIDLTPSVPEDAAEGDTLLWNLKQIKCEEAWKITRGEDIVVANIDTGVLYNHEALLESYRGNTGKSGGIEHDFNWFDPASYLIGEDDAALAPTSSPQDRNGHGTHTMGSIVGKNIGVAPGAKWIAARGCGYFGCSSAALTASAEWVLCPTSSTGGDENCMLGADVVSNSWGGGRGNDWFAPLVDAWLAAGVIPIFSQGNSGPSCATANSPGDLSTVIGVASSNEQFQLSRFSSRGPGLATDTFPLLKPDITAPGEKIYSSYNNGKYASLSGTSMAGPHVAGLAVLMLSANPQLTYNEVYAYMTTTAMNSEVLIAPGTGPVCGNITYNVYPNYHYGHGLIDAAAAVQKAWEVPYAAL